MISPWKKNPGFFFCPGLAEGRGAQSSKMLRSAYSLAIATIQQKKQLRHMEDGTGLSMSMLGSSVNLRFQQLQTSDTSSKGSSQQLLLPASNAMSAKQKCSVPRCQQPLWSLWKRRSSTLFIVVVERLINIFLTAHSNPVKLRTLARPTNCLPFYTSTLLGNQVLDKCN